MTGSMSVVSESLFSVLVFYSEVLTGRVTGNLQGADVLTAALPLSPLCFDLDLASLSHFMQS